MPVTQIFQSLSTCVNILPYYSDFFDCCCLLSNLSRSTRGKLLENFSALQRSFSTQVEVCDGFDKGIAEMLKKKLSKGRAIRRISFLYVYLMMKIKKLKVTLRNNEQVRSLCTFIEQTEGLEMLDFVEISIPVVVSRDHRYFRSFYPPLEQSTSCDNIMKLYEALILKDLDLSLIKFTTRFQLNHNIFDQTSNQPQNYSSPIQNGYIADFARFLPPTTLEITSSYNLSYFSTQLLLPSQLILPGHLLPSLFDFSFTTSSLCLNTTDLIITLPSFSTPPNSFTPSSSLGQLQAELGSAQAKQLLTKEGCSVVFRNLAKFKVRRVLVENEKWDFEQDVFEGGDVMTNNTSWTRERRNEFFEEEPACVLENELSNEDDLRPNPIEVYYFDTATGSCHSFCAKKVEMNTEPLRVYPSPDFIQVDYSKCNFYGIYDKDGLDTTNFGKFIADVKTNFLSKIEFGDEHHLWRDLLEISEELDKTVFIKCPSISTVSGCKSMWSFIDQTFYLTPTPPHKLPFHHKIQHFHLTCTDFSTFPDQSTLLKKLLCTSTPTKIHLTSHPTKNSFDHLLACFKLSLTDLALTLTTASAERLTCEQLVVLATYLCRKKLEKVKVVERGKETCTKVFYPKGSGAEV
ncbi:unnamed protein product [Moneuplotes crassus]|uniref:Uncharacterized protein n=1 Tax=Euplotes crassus TaxID=5936 RepID=A0AAD1U6V8_EUPCR|nr:unnamed protein product [Moneuplotes crassus]